MTGWLILGHLLNRQQREHQHEEDAAEAVLLLVLFLVPAIVLFMPYLIWIAARDHGTGHVEAAVWLAGGLAAVWAVAVLAGPWWAVAMAYGLALAALVAIIVIARTNALLRAESRGYNDHIS